MNKLKYIILFLTILTSINTYADDEVINIPPDDILLTQSGYFFNDISNSGVYLGKKKLDCIYSCPDENNENEIHNYLSNFLNYGNNDQKYYYGIGLNTNYSISNLKVYDYEGNEMDKLFFDNNSKKIYLYFDSFFEKIEINSWNSKRNYKYGSGYVFEPKNIKIQFDNNGQKEEVNFLFKFNIPQFEVLNQISYDYFLLNDENEVDIKFPNGVDDSGIFMKSYYGNISYDESFNDNGNILKYKITNPNNYYNEFNLYFYGDYDIFPLLYNNKQTHYFSKDFCPGEGEINNFEIDFLQNRIFDYNSDNKILDTKLKIEKFDGSKFVEITSLQYQNISFPQEEDIDLANKLKDLEKGIYRFSLVEIKTVYEEFGCEFVKNIYSYSSDDVGEILIKLYDVDELESQDDLYLGSLFNNYSINIEDKFDLRGIQRDGFKAFFNNYDLESVVSQFEFTIKTSSGNIIFTGGLNCLSTNNLDLETDENCGIDLRNKLIQYYSNTGIIIDNLISESYYQDIYGFKDFSSNKNFSNEIINYLMYYGNNGAETFQDYDLVYLYEFYQEDQYDNYDFTYINGENISKINKPFQIKAITSTGGEIDIEEVNNEDLEEDNWGYVVSDYYNNNCNSECHILLYIPTNLDIKSIKYIFNDERIFNFSLNETTQTQENYIGESKEKLGNNDKVKINYGLLEKPSIDDLLFVQKFNFSNLDDSMSGVNSKDYFKIKEINITGENINQTNLNQIYYCKEFFNTKEDILKKCTSSLDKQYLLNQQLYIYGFNGLVNDDYSSLNIKIFFDFWNINIMA